jgi:hypothetical protein
MAEIAQELKKWIIDFVNGTWDAKREHKVMTALVCTLLFSSYALTNPPSS